MPRNYYFILGIPEDSSQADIKAAYRRLAKEYHPDHFGKNQSPFQIIHEAYSTLRDPSSRRTYDTALQGSIQIQRHRHEESLHRIRPEVVEPLIPEHSPGQRWSGPPDRSIHHYPSLLDSLFDRMLTSFVEDRHFPSEGVRLKDMTVEIVLTPEQAARGGNVRLSVPVRIHCPSCRGYGEAAFHNCWRCNGAGYLTGEKTLLISYPAGIGQNHTMRIAINEQSPLTAVFTIEERR